VGDVFVEQKAEELRALLDVLALHGGAKDFCFIFLRTLLAVMPASLSGRT
jgi:hypothetical protein